MQGEGLGRWNHCMGRLNHCMVIYGSWNHWANSASRSRSPPHLGLVHHHQTNTREPETVRVYICLMSKSDVADICLMSKSDVADTLYLSLSRARSLSGCMCVWGACYEWGLGMTEFRHAPTQIPSCPHSNSVMPCPHS